MELIPQPEKSLPETPVGAGASPVTQSLVQTSIPLTPEQKVKMEAIELAANVLDEAEVPFIIFASPDSISENVKFTSCHRLTYATDLIQMTKEMNFARSSLVGVAMTQLSRGMKGDIILRNEARQPIYIFKNGKSENLMVKPEPKIIL